MVDANKQHSSGPHIVASISAAHLVIFIFFVSHIFYSRLHFYASSSLKELRQTYTQRAWVQLPLVPI